MIVAKQIAFPLLLLLLQPEFEKKEKKNLNMSNFSFYQSQHGGVFHNQVLRRGSGTPCPRGLCRERGECQVLRGLPCYYRHTVPIFYRARRTPPAHRNCTPLPWVERGGGGLVQLMVNFMVLNLTLSFMETSSLLQHQRRLVMWTTLQTRTFKTRNFGFSYVFFLFEWWWWWCGCRVEERM